MAMAVKEAVSSGIFKDVPNDNQHSIYCVVCKCSINGEIPAESHLKGIKHLKSLRRTGFATQSSSSLQQAVGISSIKDKFRPSDDLCSTPIKKSTTTHEDMHSSTMVESDLSAALRNGIMVLKNVDIILYHCQVCDITVTGDVPANMHLAGKLHLKKVSRHSRTSCISSTSIDGSLPTTSNSSNNSVASRLPTYPDVDEALCSGVLVSHVGNEMMECSVCPSGGIMAGIATAHYHLVGKAHQKMLSRSAMYPVTAKHDISSVSNDVDSSNMDHGVASDRLKEALSSGVLRAKAGGLANGDGYDCAVCLVAMTGLKCVMQHLEGSKHMAVINRKATSTVRDPPHVDANNSSSSSSASSNNMADDTDATLSVQLNAAVTAGVVMVRDGVYKCMVCQVTCQWHTDMTRHLTSIRHHQLIDAREAASKSSAEPVTTMQSDKLCQYNGVLDLEQLVTKGIVEVLVINNKQEQYRCVGCNIIVNGVSSLEQHVNGDKHRKALDREHQLNANKQMEWQSSDDPSCNAPLSDASSGSESDSRGSPQSVRRPPGSPEIICVGLDDPIPELNY